MKSFILPFFIVSILLFVSPPIYGIDIKTTVFLKNGISNKSKPVVVQCSRYNRDLGTQTLNTGEELQWELPSYTFPEFYHYCCLNWNSLSKGVLMFGWEAEFDIIKKYCRLPNTRDRTCKWVTKEDGIYIGNGNSTWTKLYDWQKYDVCQFVVPPQI